MATRKKVVEVEEIDEEEVELEDFDEVEDEEEPPAKAKTKTKPAKKAEPEIWGVRSLISLIKEKTGKEYNPREVRTLLRKLAREDGGVDREIIAGNKSRYEWTGADDPEVKAILKSVKGGAIEKSKKEALDKLKSDKAKKTAAAAKKKVAVDEDDDDDDDD